MSWFNIGLIVPSFSISYPLDSIFPLFILSVLHLLLLLDFLRLNCRKHNLHRFYYTITIFMHNQIIMTKRMKLLRPTQSKIPVHPRMKSR